MKSARKYGWKPDLPDHRDRLYRHRIIASPLPELVDLRPHCPPIVDQGELGSCTGNALAGALGYLELRDQKPLVPMSRLFIYYNERSIEGSIDQDSGAEIRDGIKCLVDNGACSEESWPYDINRFTSQPPPACYAEGLTHVLQVYERCRTVEDIQDSLAAGFPVVVGITVYNSFESGEVASSGIVSLPAADEESIGGHCVLIVGYDMKEKMFIVRNSWGTDWGLAGYFMLPFAYIANENLADDFWSVRTAEGM